jgi:hypothetical protein
MAFLDNSGDIILDAVLTDAGRQRMARGNFKITKFALGDEEINYGIYNSSHPSGSAFYDLEVMQTPILEAFTNNTSLMKSKLVSMSRNNILYMPIFKLNNNAENDTPTDSSTFPGGYILLADTNTEQSGSGQRINAFDDGILRGVDASIGGDGTTHIAIDQGINSSESGLSFKSELPDDLLETAFLIRVDHRLIQLHEITPDGGAPYTPNKTRSLINQFVDDDGIASYYVALGDGTTTVESKPGTGPVVNDGRKRQNLIGNTDPLTQSQINEAFPGPLGSVLRIYPRASLHVQQSSALFNELGTTVAAGTDDIDAGYKFIDTLINVVGVTTGYSIDIPVRIVRKT